MAGNDPIPAPTSIPIRSRHRSMAPPPAKRGRLAFSHRTGRVASMPALYGHGHGPFLGNHSPGQSTSPFTPESRSGLASPSSFSSPPTASPESSSKLVASLESMKEPDPTRFSFACPMALPAKVRFPLIDSPEPDSPKNNGATATPAPLFAANGNVAKDCDPPAYDDYETEEEDWVPNSPTEDAVMTPAVVAGGQPGLWQAPEQPKPKKAEIVEAPATPVPVASGQNVRFTKTRDDYVKYLVNRFRQYESNTGCTTPERVEKYPSTKDATQDAADEAYGPRGEEKKEEKNEEVKERSNQGSKEEIKKDNKAKEECQAQGHQPAPTEPSPPQSSSNNAEHGHKGRKRVTRVFRKIKNFFKRKEPVGQAHEMAELTRARTKAPKGNAEGNTEQVKNGSSAKTASATAARPYREGYTEERGETSAEGARKYAAERAETEMWLAYFSLAKRLY
ncbi:uncharacterized protein F4807DRAFT_460266 [Annulohypoxylon truncatum]|uniref:uncharacterized protein n=1 Tax=Annulohypoxylon truncatum TaxID=327061 RepID=UPI00200724D8|nr:uncharacterized protein F4807DRAFT_460266 [Annulohypoxylon truncatum]KAI1209977.1 hypothetical protein F4807DRAFT_460266 [Annulohypoxylon truncatum]